MYQIWTLPTFGEGDANGMRNLIFPIQRQQKDEQKDYAQINMNGRKEVRN